MVTREKSKIVKKRKEKEGRNLRNHKYAEAIIYDSRMEHRKDT